MDNMQALYQHWSSFGLPAYDATTVPDDAQMPYITYEAIDDVFGESRQISATLWYRDTSWQSITEKSKEILQNMTRGGKIIPTDEGAIWLKPGSPWAQRLSEATDDAVRRIVLAVQIEFIS